MWKEFLEKSLLDKITQVWIFVFGVTAMLLISRPGPLNAWGYVFGLIAQPAWFYTTIKNRQFGILILSCIYMYAWCQGIWFNLLRDVVT